MERMPLHIGEQFTSATAPEVRLAIARLQWLIDGERVIGTRHPEGGAVIDLSEEEWADTVSAFNLRREAERPAIP